MIDTYSEQESAEPIEGEAVPGEEAAEPIPVAQALLAAINSPNLAVDMAEDDIAKLASRVIEEYKIDDLSRETWKAVTKDAMELAMLAAEEKTYPFQGAANVKYPLLTTAAFQFQARAYPAIVPGDRIVKCKVNGHDPEGHKAARAERVSEFTSWQLTDQMPEWEPDTDKLLVILPIVGCAFRKRYFDPALARQVSRLVTADRLVVNYWARSLEDAPRVTEEMYLYPYEIEERKRDGRFIEFEYSAQEVSADDNKTGSSDDEDRPHKFLEQHRRWDMDGDGYAEPVIVTVHEGSQKVCRIVANFSVDSARLSDDGAKVVSIRARDFYVKYDFLPSPDGGFYGLGFGWLLASTNEAVNTNLNMMLDSAHLANIQGGFVSSALGIREKSIKIKNGEWKVLNTSSPLNQAVYPVTYPGPSESLFKLLGLLIEMGKEVASIKDVLSGETKTNMQPTTVLALIEQGMQFFTAIYKRIHRTLKAELAIHSRLNAEYLDAESYNEFFDDQQPYDPKEDFNGADKDISPASDPSTSSKMQRLAKAEFLKGWAAENPMANMVEVNKYILESAQMEDIERFIAKPPPPDPIAEALGKLALMEKGTEIIETLAKALKNVADAEAAEAGPQLDAYQMFMQQLGVGNEAGPGGLPGMAGAPDDAGGLPAPSDAGLGQGIGGEGSPVPLGAPAGQPGTQMGIPAA